MDERLCPVGEFFFVDLAGHIDKVARRCGHDRVLDQLLPQQVHRFLRRLADVDIPQPGKCPLDRKQRIRHIRVFSVIVPAGFCHFRVVFTREQDAFTRELAVVQYFAPVLDSFVVPVDHQALVFRPHIVIVVVAVQFAAPALLEFADQLRIQFFQHFVGYQFRVEQVPALLDIINPRLPKQVEQVDLADGYIPQPAMLAFVPEDPVNSGACPQFLPGVV